MHLHCIYKYTYVYFWGTRIYSTPNIDEVRTPGNISSKSHPSTGWLIPVYQEKPLKPQYFCGGFVWDSSVPSTGNSEKLKCGFFSGIFGGCESLEFLASKLGGAGQDWGGHWGMFTDAEKSWVNYNDLTMTSP